MNLCHPSLVEALNSALVQDSHGINTLGVREAAVKTLKSLGQDPRGRPFWKIFWVDKLKSGKSKLFLIAILLFIVAIGVALSLFFGLVFEDYQVAQRSLRTDATILSLELNRARCVNVTITTLTFKMTFALFIGSTGSHKMLRSTSLRFVSSRKRNIFPKRNGPTFLRRKFFMFHVGRHSAKYRKGRGSLL